MDLNASVGLNTTIGRMDTIQSEMGETDVGAVDVNDLLDGTTKLPQIKEDKDEGDEADKTDADKPKDEGDADKTDVDKPKEEGDGEKPKEEGDVEKPQEGDAEKP